MCFGVLFFKERNGRISKFWVEWAAYIFEGIFGHKAIKFFAKFSDSIYPPFLSPPPALPRLLVFFGTFFPLLFDWKKLFCDFSVWFSHFLSKNAYKMNFLQLFTTIFLFSIEKSPEEKLLWHFPKQFFPFFLKIFPWKIILFFFSAIFPFLSEKFPRKILFCYFSRGFHHFPIEKILGKNYTRAIFQCDSSIFPEKLLRKKLFCIFSVRFFHFLLENCLKQSNFVIFRYDLSTFTQRITDRKIILPFFDTIFLHFISKNDSEKNYYFAYFSIEFFCSFSEI